MRTRTQARRGSDRWVLVNDPYRVSGSANGDVCGSLEVDAVGANEMCEGGDWILNAVRGSEFTTSTIDALPGAIKWYP